MKRRQTKAMRMAGREILKDAIDAARAAGLSQELRLTDKKSIVDYFYTRFLADARRANVTW